MADGVALTIKHLLYQDEDGHVVYKIECVVCEACGEKFDTPMLAYDHVSEKHTALSD